MRTPQQQIKDLLIKMAIDGTLPLDMNELDASIFDPFVLDQAKINKFAEDQALGQYLSDDAGLDYATIVEHLNNETISETDVSIWEPFENYDEPRIAELITTYASNMVDSLKGIL